MRLVVLFSGRRGASYWLLTPTNAWVRHANLWRQPMREILGPLALLVAVVGAAPTSFAQTYYDYPWCAVYADRSGARSCYYTSFEQCKATMSGIGGFCIRSPYYRGPQRAPARYERY
jgi:hypothetical protein